MTDEGQMGTPMDPIELAHAMRGMAVGTHAFYSELIAEGFSKDEALRLTVAWIVGTAGGKAA